MIALMSLVLVACGGPSPETSPGPADAGRAPTPPAARPARSPDGPAAGAPKAVSGVGTMLGEGAVWTLKSDEGLPICPPPGLFQLDGYRVRYSGTQRPPRPNVRMRCAPVDFDSVAPADPVPEGGFSGVRGEVTELRILLQMEPGADPVEACQPSELHMKPGTVVTASGHPSGIIAKSCELMVFTALERADG